MGRGRRVSGPIAFMPSDGRFLGSKDLQGIPAGKDGIRMSIRIVEVLELPPGEVVNGKRIEKAFWSVIFDRPPHDWLLAPWDEKPKAATWERSRKEWKIGPEVAGRIAFRFGSDARLWEGQILPIRMEVTSFGREAVWGVRPVPLPWESDPQRRRKAMDEIAAGTYQPPGLPRRDVKPDNSGNSTDSLNTPTECQPADDFDQRQPGEDDEPPPASDEPDDIEPPDDADLSVPMQGQEP